MEFIPSTHQVAGHDGSLIAKGLFAKLSTDQEANFYGNLRHWDEIKGDNQQGESGFIGDYLTNWVPNYYGTLLQNQLNQPLHDIASQLDKINVVSEFTLPVGLQPTDKQYILLNNLYEDFINPSILDIKLGKLLTDESASVEKIQRLAKVSSTTTSGNLHVRLCGMKLFHTTSSLPDLSQFTEVAGNVELGDDLTYLKFNKFFGRGLTKQTLPEALKLFFANSIVDNNIKHHYIKQFYQRLQLLYNCLLDYEIRLISASLLFIIENNPTVLHRARGDLPHYDPLVIDKYDELEDQDDDDDDDEEEEEEEKDGAHKIIKKLSSLHLIDFAHAKFVPGQGPDDNILQGIENLIGIFDTLLQDYE